MSYEPLVNIKGKCWSRPGKTTLGFFEFSLSSNRGPNNACDELEQGAITWDFQITSSASLISGSSMNWGAWFGISLEKLIGSSRLEAPDEDPSAFVILKFECRKDVESDEMFSRKISWNSLVEEKALKRNFRFEEELLNSGKWSWKEKRKKVINFSLLNPLIWTGVSILNKTIFLNKDGGSRGRIRGPLTIVGPQVVPWDHLKDMTS